MTGRVRWQRILASAALAVAVLGCLVLARHRFGGKSFDARRWQDQQQVKHGVRLAMADDLIARRSLVGLTRMEVVGMLGNPPPDEYCRGWDLVYWLGPERSYFGVDSEWLAVRFDAAGEVSQYRILRD